MSKTSRQSVRRRALGQHFLSNRTAARQIVDRFAPRSGETVLEIGPGEGVLTRPLLEAGVHVVAVEVDPSLAARLVERLGGHPGLTLHSGDVLRCDIAALVSGGPARVLANLPYAITGPVLIQLFRAAGALTEMMLMLQREVVDRLLAGPGSRTYGSLSVVAQYFTVPRLVMRLSPGSFSPPPAVDSSVVHLAVRQARELSPEAELAYPVFVRALFAHRRQTLLNNLKVSAFAGGRTPEEIRRLLEEAAIDPMRRPETLSREECLRLHAPLHRGAQNV